MNYRLYRREPVVVGSWYYVVDCTNCGKPIYLLDDPSGGAGPIAFIGDGNLSAPCPHCHHEGEYRASDVSVIQAQENLEGTHPPRVKTSKASRKPLTKTQSKARATFGVGFVEDRPQAAAIIARIITSWADVEVQCARLLAELMGTNARPAAAVFGSLRSSRAQHDALAAAAEVILDDKDYELFAAHMARRSSLEKERNDLAHGCFGVSVAIPDSVIWVSQSDYLTFTANKDHDQKAAETFRSKQAIYELGTLERIAQEIVDFHAQLGFFIGYLVARHGGLNGQAFRAERYPQLCNQPHIREALRRVRAAKKGR